uniref:Chymotrypsin-like elastase family member 3B n=1 Tax=Salarias fasciatus TaxID=181472 RepID=A0A672JDH1_SALFA
MALFVYCASGCGVPTYPPDTGRVVNGDEARPYSWPWQVSLESFFPTCGGTLIAPNWVLTAAHCITRFHTYRVVLAEHDMNEEEGPEQSIMVEKMFIHPKWNDNCVSCGSVLPLPAANARLMRSSVGFFFSNRYGRFNYYKMLNTKRALLFPSAGGPQAATLQQALLPVVGHSVCSRSDWWGSSAKTTMVCAGGESQSACHGDSGGPLNCRGRDGRWYVEGVTSFVDGRGCNTPQKPTVFTRVASFIPWISEQMNNKRRR